MSPSRFPLVVFGDIDQDRRPGRLIDPPSGAELDNAMLDLPLGVDSVTEARKARELCRNGSPHRKCLTGVRQLEASGQSRLSGLLDGTPSEPLLSDSQFMKEPAFNSGAATADPGMWSNRSIIMPWITVPGTNTPSFLDGPINALHALVSFLVVVAFYMGWFTARNTRGRGAVDASKVTKEEATTSSPTALEIVDVLPSVSTTIDGTSSLPSSTTPLVSTDPDPPPSSPQVRSSLDPKVASVPSDGEESDRDGDGDGDAPATPGKRKGRRGRRGKKKKVIVPRGETGEDDNPKEKFGNSYPDPGHANVETKDISPHVAPVVLPTKAVVNTPSLVVSDTVLGGGSPD
jgi:serine/threonine-protein kinase/endoribonuclease IRE1